MTIVDKVYTGQTILDGAGNGKCFVVPPSGNVWAPQLGILSTSTATLEPLGFLYRGNSVMPIAILDTTFQGGGDSSGKVSGTLYYAGQAIWAVWTGGDPGANATFQLFVKEGVTGDPIQAGPVGAGFTAQTLSPAQIAAALVNSTLSSVIALAVSTQGVPAIDRPQAVSVVLNQAVAAGATFTSGHIDVSRYQSLVGIWFAQENSAPVGTNPYMRVQLSWSLAADNYDPLVTEVWVPAVGPFSFVQNYRNDFATPCYGDTLDISVFNYDSKQINVTWGLFGSYRQRIRSFMRGRYPDNFSNEANGLGSDDVLAAFNPGLIPAGNSSAIQLLQLWEGPVTVSGLCGNSPGIGNVVLTITPQPTSILGVSNYIVNDRINTISPQQVILPRRVCTLQIQNTSAVGINPTILVTGQVQPN